MKKNLLTIGEVSKKTGCSIKSLRYYDSIGILEPTFVDAHTNYRYYTFEQTKIVDIIQICILLDIPLKDVKKLIVKDDNTVDYTNLIEYGRKITKEKMIKLKHNLDILDNLQYEIERLNSYDNDEEKSFHIHEKYYHVLPFLDDEINDNYYKQLNYLFTNAAKHNIFFKNDYGIIINIKDNEINKFVAIEIHKKHRNLKNVIKINEGDFLCKKTDEFNLVEICNMFDYVKSPDKNIIITPGYNYDLSCPYFEVRCSL